MHRYLDIVCGLLLTLWVVVPQAAWAQAAPERPYDCGFVLPSLQAIEETYGPELAVLDLQPGDVIADIGGSNGYRMGMFAALIDSLHIYVQDIDSLCLNATELQKVIAWHTQLKGAPLHSTFELVLGDARQTHLPAGTFDKILVTVAYHHFEAPAVVLADIAGKLKPGGRIYLIENVVRRDGQRRRKLCDDPLLSEASLRLAFEAQGLRVVGVHALGRWWTKLFVLEPTDVAE